MHVYAYNTTYGEQWKEFIADRHSGQTVTIDEKMYLYWLEVLPPVYMGRSGAGRHSLAPASAHGLFGFAEGYERITDFWRDGDQFFCRQSERMNHP